MIEIKLGKRYAKSIYGLAAEQNSVEEVRNDFDLIRLVLNQNPEFLQMLQSPLIFADRKQKVVDSIFGGKLSKITSELIRIIIRKGREPWLRDIAECFQGIYDEHHQITRGELISAAPMTAEEKKKIVSLVEKELTTTFFLEEKIDPAIVGGFVLRVGDRLIDGSIKGKLDQLRQEFEKNPYIPVV